MRTTVTLDRDVERILRETALRTHKPFKKVPNDTLRTGIELTARTAPRSRSSCTPAPWGCVPEIDPVGFNRLADVLEPEAFLENTRKLMDRTR